MKRLFLAWQATRAAKGGAEPTRAWYPIGRLEPMYEEGGYRFAYIGGAVRAQREAGLEPLEAFPEFERVYESPDLFPLFRNRLLSPRRPDYRRYLERLALDPDHADPMDVLAISEGRRQTDNLEVFPELVPRPDRSFRVRFFLHGHRHVSPPAQRQLDALRGGERLQVAVELNNPATGRAVQLQTAGDYYMIGWAPRYLASDLVTALSYDEQAVRAEVVRVNPTPAPPNQRVMVELSGIFPPSFEPMSAPDYQPITEVERVH